MNRAQTEAATIHTGNIPPMEFIEAYRNKASKLPAFRLRRLVIGNQKNIHELSDWIVEDFRVLGRKYEIRVLDTKKCSYKGMILIDNKEVMYRKSEKVFYSDDANIVSTISREFEILWSKAKDFMPSLKDE